MLYTKKLFRDLRAQKGQVIAVTMVTALGVMLFVASAGAYRDLRDSYAEVRARLALARLHVDVTAIDQRTVERLRAAPGVESIEARVVTEIPVSAGGDSRVHADLRVISIPDDKEPALDRLLVLEGALPGNDEVLLEKHFARHHRIGVGAALSVGDGAKSLRVSGVAVSPEYLWVARDENDFMPSPDQFGVGWMRRASLRTLATALVLGDRPGVASPSLRVAASEALGTQVLIQPSKGADPAAIMPLVREALGAPRVLGVTKSEDLVGVKLMQMDLDGYRGMAVFFPFFFLGVGAFIVGSALARLVDAQRSIIGTLMALGVGRAKILGHYVSFAAVLGGVGAVIGGALGLAASPGMTEAYATELNIPFVEAHVHFDLLIIGFAMGLGIAVLAGFFPALRAMRLSPAESMRPARPKLGALARVARSLPLPLPVALALRDVLGRPIRSLGTALGVAAAVVLVLGTGVLLDSMKTTFSALFTDARRYDVRVDFAAARSASDVLSRVRSEPGVRRVEACIVLPATLSANAHRVDVMVQALSDDAELLRSVDADGQVTPPGPGGVTLTRSAATKLHIAIGDTVRVTPVPSGPEVVLRLTGFADAAMGSTANVRRMDIEGPWHLGGQATSVLVATGEHDAARVRADLVSAFPDAVRVEDAAATRTQFDELMGLGWVMLFGMLLFGGVLAAAILFNTATLTILERQRELSTLRALGMTMREITAALTVEHAIIALVGLGIGVPLAIVASKAMLHSFSSELFALPFVLTPMTVLVTLVGVFGVVLLAQWPALRRVSRASLAEAVRVREG